MRLNSSMLVSLTHRVLIASWLCPQNSWALYKPCGWLLWQ